MTKRPLICILAWRRDAPQEILPEATRFLKLATACDEDARFVLADGRDFLEAEDGGLAIHRGLEWRAGEFVPIRYKEDAHIHYLYKVDNGRKKEGVSSSLHQYLPTIFQERSHDNSSISEFTLFRALLCYAQQNKIPVNNSTHLARICRHKQKTDNIIATFARKKGVHLSRVSYEPITTEKELYDHLRRRNEDRIDTLLKPDADSLGNGIAIIKGTHSQDALQERFQQEDIQEIIARLREGELILACDYLTDTFTLDNRKVDLRVYICPYRREGHHVEFHYAGAVVRLAIDPHNPDAIEDKRVSLTFLKDKEKGDATKQRYILEETALYTSSFYTALMRNANIALSALYAASKDKPPQAAFLSLDYLITSQGEPCLLEVNSRGRCLTYSDPAINRYTSNNLLRTMLPEIIHQARQYQQRRYHHRQK